MKYEVAIDDRLEEAVAAYLAGYTLTSKIPYVITVSLQDGRKVVRSNSRELLRAVVNFTRIKIRSINE